MTRTGIVAGLVVVAAVLTAAVPGLSGRRPGPGRNAAGGGTAGPGPAYALPLGVCDWTLGQAGDPAAFEAAARLGLTVGERLSEDA